jgi:hypothetical protein
MFRLLSLFYLLFLSQASFSQQAGTTTTNDAPSSCPVTKPYQTSLFVPPSPYTSNAGAGVFWLERTGCGLDFPRTQRGEG